MIINDVASAPRAVVRCRMLQVVCPLLVVALLAGSCSSAGEAESLQTEGRFQAEVWADNWFSFSLGEAAVFEDSVSITTERSFNKEVFGFDGEYPLVLNFVVKDYKASDSGLEYIGTDRQQMGDGGFIAQIKDTETGAFVAVSSAAWRCLVIHRAPTDVACEDDPEPDKTCGFASVAEPDGWRRADFDASAWPLAVEYSEADVGAKDGYDEVDWDPAARLIWAESLTQDNTLLCRLVVDGQG